jgi:hypothetical protein
MKLEEIVNILERYGYTTSRSYSTDLAWAVKQNFNKVPVEEQTVKKELCLSFKWSEKDRGLSFAIYEDESVSSDGILYYTPGKMHYYFNFGSNTISRIYREDELDTMMTDIHTEMSNHMSIAELREIKLIDICGI